MALSLHYQYTSSVSTMLQDLNWCTLDQQGIDSLLVLLYKITYDLVAIPASDYLIRNTRPSSRNHQMANRQITTLKDFYKYTFFPQTIIHWNTLPHHIPTLTTLAQFRALDHPILGPKFGPIPNAKQYVFFLIPDKKIPI